nr:DUF4249 domain-containing protein [uncultured Mucilaginibacter sp.]
MIVNADYRTLGKFKVGAALLLIFCVYACKEKYVPQIKDVNPNYLVVDGFINTGTDSTIFKLSRTFKLESKAVMAVERAAIVAIESDAGASYILPELAAKPGTYAVPPLNLDQTKKYRLRIRTKDNKEYLSDFVESKVSPPVELTYDFRHGNLNIYSNTNDPTGKSRYYSYTYIETWQYRAPQHSIFKVENHLLKDRIYPKDDIYDCYHEAVSTKLPIATTATLAEDRLADNLIIDILPGSQRVRIEYSVLVKQTVLTKAGFEFYETLNKNTEKVGSIFDSQPSLLVGNIKCTSNPTEVVIGFISAGTRTEKRILLVANQFPFDFIGPVPDPYCVKHTDSIPEPKVKALLLDPTQTEYIPIDWMHPNVHPDTLLATKVYECVDCRLQGGTTKMPSYWIR